MRHRASFSSEICCGGPAGVGSGDSIDGPTELFGDVYEIL